MTMSQLVSETLENFKVIINQRWYGIELNCHPNPEIADWCYDNFGHMYGHFDPRQFRMNERWFCEKTFSMRIFIKEETDLSMFTLRFSDKIVDVYQLEQEY